MKIGYRPWLQIQQMEGRISLSVNGSDTRLPETIPPSDDAPYWVLQREVISTVKNGWDIQSKKKA